MTHLIHAFITVALLATLVTPEAPSGPTPTTRRNPVLYWNAVASQAFAPTAGPRPTRAVADIRDPPGCGPRCRQCHRRPLPAVHTGPRPGTRSVGRRGRGGCLARGDGGARPRPGQPSSKTPTLNALATIDEGPAEGCGHRRRAGVRGGDARPSSERWLHSSHAADLPAEWPARRVPVHRAVRHSPILPGWGRLTPFAIDVTDHRLAGPLRLSEWAVRPRLRRGEGIGARTSTTRTADQSQIAQFWYEDSPLGWNRIAVTVIEQQRARRMAGRPHAGPRQLRASPTPTSPDSPTSTSIGSGVR